MTCRHGPYDPDCSSYKAPPSTPDPDHYEVLDAHQAGQNMVLKIKYPSCEKCSYEGTKILVYLGASTVDALKWKRIDPHFTDKKLFKNHAPSPAARFPASEDGWKDAISYAEWRNSGN